MEVREFKKEDLDTLNNWFKDRNMPLIYSCDGLPKNGFIVENIAICFLYSSDSSLCWIGCIASNPKIENNIRREALDLVIDASLKKAKELGFKQVITSTNINSVIDRFKKHGLFDIDYNLTRLTGVL